MEVDAALAFFFKTFCLVMMSANSTLATGHTLDRHLSNIMYALIFL